MGEIREEKQEKYEKGEGTRHMSELREFLN